MTKSRDDSITVLDSLEGNIVHNMMGNVYSENKFDISHDSQYVVSGSENGKLNIWNIVTGKLIHTLSFHKKSVHAVKFASKLNLLASGCNICVIWGVLKQENEHIK